MARVAAASRLRVATIAVLWFAAVGLVAASLAISPTHRNAGEVVVAFSYQLFTTVGALIVLRRPRHPIGALFVLSGVASAVQGLSEAVVERAQHRHDLTGPFVHVAASLQSWVWMPTLVIPLVFVLLLFPDGRPLSRRWARVMWVGAVSLAVAVLDFGTISLRLPTAQLVNGETPHGGWEQVAFVLASAGVAVCLGCALLGVVSLVLRYRRGKPETRQQIKLVLFAAVLAVVAVVLGSVISDSQNVLEPLGTALIAAAVAVAVMRYRLFDIDRLISRTLSYLLVSGVLVGLYVGCVTVVTDVAGARSQVGVAASTLLAAAAFHPVRRRMQALVDRRFNRRRYDAERTVDVLRTQLRHDFQLHDVVAELLGSVSRAVEPVGVSVWLAPTPTGPYAGRHTTVT